MNLIKLLDTEINYLFFREHRFRREVRRHLSAHYNLSDPIPDNGKTIVYMADGRRLHGGLADRLRGIVTTWKYCKEHGVNFRINFVEPFRLEEYLLPAEYDWRLRTGELSYNKTACKAVFQDTRGDTGERELRWQRRVSERQFSGSWRQFHVYTAFYYAENEFGPLFSELFRPTPRLQAVIDKTVSQCGSRFISVTTRFRELLGDFKEPVKGVVPLDDAAAAGLIERLLDKIGELKERHNVERVFVTSDSARFLKAASALDYCVTLEGGISHIDANGPNDNADLKTFADFLTIARAETSYLLLGSKMYNGNFAKRAAALGGHPYVIEPV